jgi:hypothetical protein
MNKKHQAAAVALVVLGLGSGSASAQNAPPPGDIVERAVHVCNACHGEGGNSKTATYQWLASLNELGVPVIRLGTLFERMSYDKDMIVVRAGKPVEFDKTCRLCR